MRNGKIALTYTLSPPHYQDSLHSSFTTSQRLADKLSLFPKMGISFVEVPSGPTKPSSLIGIASAVPIMCIITISLRFYLRVFRQKMPLKIDDWILIPAVFFVIGMSIVTLLGMLLSK